VRLFTLDPGETLAAALAREVDEETGLDLEAITAYLGDFDYTSGSGKPSRQFNFAGRVNECLMAVLHPVPGPATGLIPAPQALRHGPLKAVLKGGGNRRQPVGEHRRHDPVPGEEGEAPPGGPVVPRTAAE
jgi:hypothetical protein